MLPACAAHTTAFNNLAVQFARPGVLPLTAEGEEGGGFWELPSPMGTSDSVPGGRGSHDCAIAPPADA